MKQILFLISALMVAVASPAKQQDAIVANSYAEIFDKAYSLYPNIPRGILEAVSFSNTRFKHLSAFQPESCTGLPRQYGVMGLTLDGKNFFNNNLFFVSNLSGIPVDDIISDPEKNILAYASAYNTLLQQSGVSANDEISKRTAIALLLSELPKKESNNALMFALNSFYYSVLSFMNNVSYAKAYNFPEYHIDLSNVFGEENYKVLSSSGVRVYGEKIRGEAGSEFKNGDGVLPFSPDYGPAIWDPTTCNYSSRNGTPVSHIAIHTVQGTYYGCIGWFQNCNAQVSAHYVIRSSDGQITQMVYESDRAWHVYGENSYTIGFEHEGYVDDASWYTNAMYVESAKLACDICNSGYGISAGDCYNGPAHNTFTPLSQAYTTKGHQHYPNQTSRSDPGINWDWGYYASLINSCGATAGSEPVSTLDVSDCNTIEGWAFDPDIPNNQIDIHIYVDGVFNTLMQTTNYRPDVNTAYGISGNHGFIWQVPNGLMDGQVHTIEIYAINDNGNNPLVTSTQIGPCYVTPTNLTVQQATCPGIGVWLNWQDSGPNFWLDIGTDPLFNPNNFYNQNVANLTSVVCPGSFLVYPNPATPQNSDYLQFQPNTTYHWRIWNGNVQTYGGSFTTPSCVYSDNNCSGTFVDFGGVGNVYYNNEDWTQTISPVNAQNVTVSFTNFDLEDQYDFLYIHDGNSITSPLIGTYTGVNSPGTITSSGPDLTFHFVSDPFVQNAGWEATWNCTLNTTDISENDNEAIIFQNNSDGIIVISSFKPINAEVSVHDILGNLILNMEKSVFTKMSLDLSSKTSGLYFIRISGDNYSRTYKTVMEK